MLIAMTVASLIGNSPWQDGHLRLESRMTVCIEVKTISLLQSGQGESRVCQQNLRLCRKCNRWLLQNAGWNSHASGRHRGKREVQHSDGRSAWGGLPPHSAITFRHRLSGGALHTGSPAFGSGDKEHAPPPGGAWRRPCQLRRKLATTKWSPSYFPRRWQRSLWV